MGIVSYLQLTSLIDLLNSNVKIGSKKFDILKIVCNSLAMTFKYQMIVIYKIAVVDT